MRLRDLVLAAGLLIPGCQTPSESVPPKQAQQSVDNIVKDALTYFQNKQYAKAQGLLEQHKQYQVLNNSDISPSARCLLALTYSMTWKFSDSETQFWAVMHEYKRNTYIADQVGTEFSEFFKTQQYQDLEKMLKAYARSYQRLNGVLGFLKVAQRDYVQAADCFALAAPHFDEKLVQEFRSSFAMRQEQARAQNDCATMSGYSAILNAITPPATIQK